MLSAESAVLCSGSQAEGQEASRGFLHAKHSQTLWKNFPILSFPKLPVFQTAIECWQYVSECLDVGRPVCADALQGKRDIFFFRG